MCKNKNEQVDEVTREGRQAKLLYCISRRIKRHKKNEVRLKCNFGAEIKVLKEHARGLMKSVGVYQGQRVVIC